MVLVSIQYTGIKELDGVKPTCLPGSANGQKKQVEDRPEYA